MLLRAKHLMQSPACWGCWDSKYTRAMLSSTDAWPRRIFGCQWIDREHLQIIVFIKHNSSKHQKPSQLGDLFYQWYPMGIWYQMLFPRPGMSPQVTFVARYSIWDLLVKSLFLRNTTQVRWSEAAEYLQHTFTFAGKNHGHLQKVLHSVHNLLQINHDSILDPIKGFSLIDETYGCSLSSIHWR